MNLPLGTYYITKSIIVPSNKVINGNNSHLVLANTNISVFTLTDISNTTILNINLKGLLSEYHLGSYTHKMEKPLVLIDNSSEIKIKEVHFSNHAFTPLKIISSSDLEISHSKFENIGADYPQGLPAFLYSYDGVYFVSETNQKCDNITISDCVFKNIGTFNYNYIESYNSINDGDGIHFQSKEKTSINNIKIVDNKFENCISRGIKAQAGNNIFIENNVFLKTKSGIGITQECPLSKVSIAGNKFDSCNIAIATNHNMIISTLSINGNEMNNINFGIRTSGGAIIDNATIEENKAKNIGNCFFDGVIKDVVFRKNRIIDFASGNDKNYYMAILIADSSDDVELSNNYFEAQNSSISGIYISENVTNVTIIDNQILLRKASSGNRYAIYNHSRDKKNIVKNNVINKIE